MITGLRPAQQSVPDFASALLLTGRAYRLTRFEAEEVGAGRWRLSIDTMADANGAELLEARLLRLPSVLTVELGHSAALAVAG